VIAAKPVEALLFHVGIGLFIRPHAHSGFVKGIVALEHGVFSDHLLGRLIAVGIIPRLFMGIVVILHVLNVAPTLKQQNLQAFFSELFSGPATANA